MKTYRSAITGKFVKAEYAEAHPDSTVGEERGCPHCKELRRLVRELISRIHCTCTTQKVTINGEPQEDVIVTCYSCRLRKRPQVQAIMEEVEGE
jgi:hypothetical protein